MIPILIIFSKQSFLFDQCSVVPTAVSTSHAQLDTFQYAVTEQARPIDHESGSHGVPGIFMKYDFASFKVEVKEESLPWYQLIIRICGIIGKLL